MAMRVGENGRGLFYGTFRNLLGETKKHHEEHQTTSNCIKITLVSRLKYCRDEEMVE